jgi:hypothetical protein
MTVSSNYRSDRSNSFKHNTPDGLLLNGSPTVDEYRLDQERRQSSQLRDWRLTSQSMEKIDPPAKFQKARKGECFAAKLTNPKVCITLSSAVLLACLALSHFHF